MLSDRQKEAMDQIVVGGKDGRLILVDCVTKKECTPCAVVCIIRQGIVSDDFHVQPLALIPDVDLAAHIKAPDNEAWTVRRGPQEPTTDKLINWPGHRKP